MLAESCVSRIGIRRARLRKELKQTPCLSVCVCRSLCARASLLARCLLAVVAHFLPV